MAKECCKLEKEIWEPVKGYEGMYEVSNQGRVRSLDRIVKGNWGNERTFPGKILKLETTYQGYKRVRLSKDGKSKRFTAHRLVAETFIGKYPEGCVINHIDENKSNNQVENLEYVTQKENINHGTRTKRMAKKQSMKIKGTHIETGKIVMFPSMMAAERETDGYFHNGHISQAVAGKLPHHRGFVWERVEA